MLAHHAKVQHMAVDLLDTSAGAEAERATLLAFAPSPL